MNGADLIVGNLKQQGIRFASSGVATSSIEQTGAIGGNTWYQHYATVDADINSDLLQPARASGFEALAVTVDIPTATRSDRAPARINQTQLRSL